MNYDKIRAALETQLAGITGIPQIAWENTSFDPVTGIPWVRAKFLPAKRTPAAIGQTAQGKAYQHLYTGAYQIIVAYPEGKGAGPSQTMVNTIIDAFDSTSDLQNDDVYVTISNTEQMRAYEDSPWYKTPINVYWYCYNN